MVKTAAPGAQETIASAIYQYPAMIIVWEWFVGRTDTVWMGWMSTSAPVIVALLGGSAISTSMSVRELTAVEMADVLMKWAPSDVNAILATLVYYVRLPVHQ